MNHTCHSLKYFHKIIINTDCTIKDYFRNVGQNIVLKLVCNQEVICKSGQLKLIIEYWNEFNFFEQHTSLI